MRKTWRQRPGQVLRCLAKSQWLKIDPQAGKGPTWALWAATFCGALILVAFTASVLATFSGNSPRTDFIVLFGTFCLISVPLRRLRLHLPANCLLLLGALSVPLILTLP